MNNKRIDFSRMQRRLLQLLVIVCLYSLLVAPALAKKKLLILEFTNIEEKKEVQYLENSIHKAVLVALEEKFVFQEPEGERWRKVSADNNLYKEDYYTRSVALNIGLLTRQDVVITGLYQVSGTPGKEKIQTKVWIYDTENQTAVAAFEMSGPADNRIFETLNDMAGRIAEEAKVILPGKEEWQKTAYEDPVPFFRNPYVGAGSGYGFFANDYAGRIELSSPFLSAYFGGRLYILGWQPWLKLELGYVVETPKSGQNAALKNLTVATKNYTSAASIGHRFHLPGGLAIVPRLGGGYLYQTITVTGYRNSDLTGGMFFAQAAVDIEYRLTTSISLVLTPQAMLQFQDENRTLLNLATAGIRYDL